MHRQIVRLHIKFICKATADREHTIVQEIKTGCLQTLHLIVIIQHLSNAIIQLQQIAIINNFWYRPNSKLGATPFQVAPLTIHTAFIYIHVYTILLFGFGFLNMIQTLHIFAMMVPKQNVYAVTVNQVSALHVRRTLCSVYVGNTKK